MAAALFGQIRRDIGRRFAHDAGHELLVKVQAAPKAEVTSGVEQFLAKARAAGL